MSFLPFSGVVVHGQKYGRKLGYPTANLNISATESRCEPGVYAATAWFCETAYQAALVVNGELNSIEVYLFEYQGDDFYDSHLRVLPIKKVSDMIRFDSESALKDKIEADLRLIQEVFGKGESEK